MNAAWTNENAETDFETMTAATVRPVNWKAGDDAFNLRELLLNSREDVTNAVPEMKGMRYGLDSKQIERSDGSLFPDSKFLRLVKGA